MEFHTWSLKLQLMTPFHFGGDASSQAEIDSPLYRDERQRVAVPGPHISGHFRHFMIQVAEAEDHAKLPEADRLARWSDIIRWFGVSGRQLRNPEETEIEEIPSSQLPPGARKWSRTGVRGRLTFRDIPVWNDPQAPNAEGQNSEPNLHTRTRIRIDRNLGSVATGAWQTMEQWDRSNACVTFERHTGEPPTVELFADAEERRRFERAFQQFGLSLASIGGNKGQGFGRVVKESLKLDAHCSIAVAVPPIAALPAKEIDLTLSLEHPLLVEPQIRSGNLFRSSETISGGALKAAIAEYIALAAPSDQEALSEALTEMVLGPFEPIDPQQGLRSEVRSADLVWVWEGPDSGRFVSAWTSIPDDTEIALQQELKDGDPRIPEIPRHRPLPINRTRTAISLRAFTAAEHKLFNYQSLSTRGTAWRGRVVVNQKSFAHRSDAGRILDFLNLGFVQIGKLKSRILGASAKPTPPVEDSDPWNKGAIRTVLRSPAHLIRSQTLQGIAASRDPHALYAEAFRAAFAGVTDEIDWTEFRVAARHVWHGGIKAVRYPQEVNGTETYYPYLLTEIGSAFCLVLKDPIAGPSDQLSQHTEMLRLRGLPSADEARGWEKNPFVRANGYGQIRLDAISPPSSQEDQP